MKNKIYYPVIVVFLLWLTAYQGKGQQKVFSNFLIGIESGVGHLNGKMNERWDIRQDLGDYNYDRYTNNGSIFADMYHFNIGIKGEYSFFNKKLSVLSGVKYKQIYNGLITNNNKFFYLRYKQDNTTTEFIRIRDLNEYNHYIAVPLEIKYMPFKVFKRIGIYGKVGIELGALLQSRKEINFHSEAMKQYEDEIFNTVVKDEVNKLLASYYAMFGVSFFLKNKTVFNIDILLPSGLWSKNNSSLIDPSFYGGVQFAIQVPLSKFSKIETVKKTNHE